MQLRIVSILVCMFLLSGQMKAYHIIGGELYYDCLGGNNYQVTLKLYRDCSNPDAAPYDDPLQIYVFNASGILVDSLVIPFPGSITISPDLTDPCITAAPDLCIQQAIYTGIIHLDASIGGYDLVYQRCCRNTSIINLESPGTTGVTYIEHVPNPADGCNSSPRYTNFPPIVICAGYPLIFDHSATDPDGDDLEYELCYAYSGADDVFPDPSPAASPPYIPVLYTIPYSESFPMDASPALSINATSGLLTGTPTTLGQFVVCICVSEYRSGVLIGTHRRDFQFNVADCDPLVIAATDDHYTNCTDYTVDFSNSSFGTDQYLWNFGVLGIASDTSNVFEPSFTYPDTGTYTVSLIALPGSGCADTFYSSVVIYPVLQADMSFADGCSGTEIQFTDNSTDDYNTIISWHWNFGDGSSSTDQNPTHIYTDGGTYTVKLTVENTVGCSDNIIQTILIEPSPEANFLWDIACLNQLLTFTNTSTIAGGIISDYNWLFSDGYMSTAESPTHIFTSAGTYSISLTAYSENGCVDSIVRYIAIPDTVVADIKPDTTICEGDTIQLWARNGYYYQWFADAFISDTDIFNPYIAPTETTTYGVVVSDDCTADTAYITITVLPKPDITAYPDTTIFRGHSVQLFVEGDGITYTWLPSDGLNTADIINPVATPGTTTAYVVYAIGANGCSASDTAFIIVEEPCNRYIIVNAFSPNGDGHNDVFRILDFGEDNVQNLSIYDRWGQKVFEAGSINEGWDGKSNGKDQEIGTYIYILQVECEGILKQITGSITLLR